MPKGKYIFGRDIRLSNKADYSNVFGNACRLNGKYWQILTTNTKNKSRLGLAIAKKVINKSCARNLYKRIAREVFRKNKGELKNLDIVIMARKNCNSRKLLNAELQNMITSLANKQISLAKKT